MTAQLSRERREIIKQTANHIISREDTSEHSENLKAVAELDLLALAGMCREPVGYLIKDKYTPNGYFSHKNTILSISEEDITEHEVSATPLYSAPPAPVAVPDESAVELLATDLMKLIDKITGERHSVATLSSLRVSIVEACRAAMLKAGPVTAAAIPDGWKLVPVDLTGDMTNAMQ